jgi:hypothetical protein
MGPLEIVFEFYLLCHRLSGPGACCYAKGIGAVDGEAENGAKTVRDLGALIECSMLRTFMDSYGQFIGNNGPRWTTAGGITSGGKAGD